MGNFSNNLARNGKRRGSDITVLTEADLKKFADEYDFRLSLETPSPAKFRANIERIEWLEGVLSAAASTSPAARHAMRDRTHEPLPAPTRDADDPDNRPFDLIGAALKMLLDRPPLEGDDLAKLREATNGLMLYILEREGRLQTVIRDASEAVN